MAAKRASQEALATQGTDFDFYGANVPVKWEDGETDRSMGQPDGLRWVQKYAKMLGKTPLKY